MSETLSRATNRRTEPTSVFRACVSMLRQRRKQARDLAHLKTLPDELLKDIGVSRHDVERDNLPSR